MVISSAKYLGRQEKVWSQSHEQSDMSGTKKLDLTICVKNQISCHVPKSFNNLLSKFVAFRFLYSLLCNTLLQKVDLILFFLEINLSFIFSQYSNAITNFQDISDLNQRTKGKCMRKSISVIFFDFSATKILFSACFVGVS